MAQCSKRVKNKLMLGTHQCYNRATVERNGRDFCAIHDPVAIRAKNEAREAEYHASRTVEPSWKQRIRELEARLRDLDWTPISESNLPRAGDEVGRRKLDGLWIIHLVGSDERLQFWTFWGWTHRRPINAPDRTAKT